MDASRDKARPDLWAIMLPHEDPAAVLLVYELCFRNGRNFKTGETHGESKAVPFGKLDQLAEDLGMDRRTVLSKMKTMGHILIEAEPERFLVDSRWLQARAALPRKQHISTLLRIPRSILANPGLFPLAKTIAGKVYECQCRPMAMNSKSKKPYKFWPSVGQLSKDLGRVRKVIRKAEDSLKRAGCYDVENDRPGRWARRQIRIEVSTQKGPKGNEQGGIHTEGTGRTRKEVSTQVQAGIHPHDTQVSTHEHGGIPTEDIQKTPQETPIRHCDPAPTAGSNGFGETAPRNANGNFSRAWKEDFSDEAKWGEARRALEKSGFGIRGHPGGALGLMRAECMKSPIKRLPEPCEVLILCATVKDRRDSENRNDGGLLSNWFQEGGWLGVVRERHTEGKAREAAKRTPLDPDVAQPRDPALAADEVESILHGVVPEPGQEPDEPASALPPSPLASSGGSVARDKSWRDERTDIRALAAMNRRPRTPAERKSLHKENPQDENPETQPA